MRRFNLSIYYMFILAIALLTGCSSSTQSSKNSLEGHVSLVTEDQNAENIQVLVYHLAILDADITTLNVTSPNHGVILSQRMIFDHRKAVPAYSAITDSGGNFVINNVESGVYNVVIYREDVGYTYIYEKEIYRNIDDFHSLLKPIVILPAIIDNEYQMDPDRVYQAASSVYILPSGSILVNEGCSLLISPGVTFTIEGSLVTPMNSSLSIRSSDKTFTHSNAASSIQRYSQINFNNQNSKELRYIYLSDSVYGLYAAYSNDILISDSIFSSDYQSVIAQNCSSFNIEKCIILNSTNISRGAVYFENSSNMLVTRNIFKNNNTAVYYNRTAASRILNNYFVSNATNDIYGGELGVMTIEKNTFRNSNTAIYNYAGQMTIIRNSIQANVGVFSQLLNATFSAQYNNFECTVYGIRSECWFYGTDLHPMTCTFNYWNTINLSEIEALTYDRDNEDPSDPYYRGLLSIVVFQPFQTSPNVAGIYN